MGGAYTTRRRHGELKARVRLERNYSEPYQNDENAWVVCHVTGRGVQV